jgi:hypothetical protein
MKAAACESLTNRINAAILPRLVEDGDARSQAEQSAPLDP